MHSVLRFLDFLIPPRFHCMDHHQHISGLSLQLPCLQNHSRNIWCSTHIPLFWAFWMLHAIVMLYIRFNIHREIVFADIWNFQVAIPGKPIFSVRNAFCCAILIAFDWMNIDSCDLADIEYLSSSSREVRCRHSWWQRWPYWQCERSHTTKLKEWPGWVDDLFHSRNVSSSCHQLVVTARSFPCSMYVFTAPPHLHNVMDLGQSVQYSLLRLFLHFQVVICVSCIKCWVIAC